MNSPRRLATAALVAVKHAFIPVVAALFAAFACTAQNLHAEDIRFTVSGTVMFDNAAVGYTADQPVTFFWTLNDYAPATPVGTVFSDQVEWKQETVGTEPRLWENIGGTGIRGTFVEGSGGMPYDTVEIRNSSIVGSSLNLKLRTEGFNTTDGNHGIYSSADPSYFVKNLTLDMRVAEIPWNLSLSELPNPASYFANYLGTYPIISTDSGSLDFNNGSTGRSVYFRVNTLTISAVPEPSTYAMALAGLACGGYSMFRRRKRA